ncbi:D-galactonate transporter [Xenorhabdus poinarii G6]|uniref:D-galactonate transporter n=1 Tax=Xenorhabdus poinarii G6 TaxID=1354304 RepID=A0A068R486_9GAMM|nr:MFS transporter [Xenorhabdus poinarii]CDG21829.1 D-galactonate transporter [Xenorhabdus poinarii G6]
MQISERPTRRRYFVVFMLFVIVIINYIDRANLAIASPHIEAEFGLSSVQMGYIFSAFGWTYALFQIPGGQFLDLIGSKITYFIAILGWSTATLFQGFANGFISLLTLRAITGVFEAPSFPTNNRVISSWYPEQERAGAIAIYTSGQYVGLAFFTPVLIWVQHVLSWHWVFIMTGTVGIFWSFFWLMKYKSVNQDQKVNEAERQHILSGGAISDDEDIQGENKTKARHKLTLTDWKLVFHPKLLGVYIVQFALATTVWFFLTWFPTYLSKGRDIDLSTTELMTAIPFIAAFLGVISGGFLADKLVRMGKSIGIARKTPILIGLVLSMSIVLANYTTNINIIVCLLAIAFFGNGFASQAWSLVSSMAPVHLIGTSGGCFNFFGALGGVSVPIIVGYLAQYYGFVPALVYIALVVLLSIISFLFLIGKVERIKHAGLAY